MAATREYVLKQVRLNLNDQSEDESTQRFTNDEIDGFMLDGITKIFELRPESQVASDMELETLPTTIDGSTTTLPISVYMVEPLVNYICGKALLTQGGETFNIVHSRAFTDQFNQSMRG